MAISDLRERFPLRDSIYKFYPEGLVRERTRYDEYRCPFHDDKRASMLVFEDHCMCQAGCDVNGRTQGDFFDFIKDYMNLANWQQVEDFLTGTHVEHRPRLRVYDKPVSKLAWSDVERGLKHQQEAMPWYVGRGLEEATVKAHYLGKFVSYPFYVDALEKRFFAKRYALPDVAYGVVRSVELRRDDADAQRTLDAMPPDMLALAGEEDPRDFFFGPRFLAMRGGLARNLIYNIERVMKRIEHDGKQGWFCPDLEYLLIHEGRIKALSMDQLGYPSVAAKGAPGLASLTGVKNLFIVVDNDEDKIVRGKVRNPGKAYAARNVELSGRTLGRNIHLLYPPPGFKDADEVVRAGLAHEWMKNIGLERIG